MWGEVVSWLTEGLKWAVALGTGILAVRSWVIKPIQKIQKEQETVNQKLSERIDKIADDVRTLRSSMDTVEGDVADTLGDRLTQAHTHYMSVGWCPAAEKQRLVQMRERYAARGHNHLAEHYEQDILGLPEHPPGK